MSLDERHGALDALQRRRMEIGRRHSQLLDACRPIAPSGPAYSSHVLTTAASSRPRPSRRDSGATRKQHVVVDRRSHHRRTFGARASSGVPQESWPKRRNATTVGGGGTNVFLRRYFDRW
jgi:hypothetical protein